MKKSCGKKGIRGQMKLSFGMIFSIILIIVFIAFAFYVVKIFLGSQSQSLALMFAEDLQNDVNDLWKRVGSYTNTDGYSMPSKVEMVCFADFSADAKGGYEDIYRELKFSYSGFENLFFYPLDAVDSVQSTEIEHLNLEEITSNKNPFCIETENNKIFMTIKRDYGESLVLIEEV